MSDRAATVYTPCDPHSANRGHYCFFGQRWKWSVCLCGAICLHIRCVSSRWANSIRDEWDSVRRDHCFGYQPWWGDIDRDVFPLDWTWPISTSSYNPCFFWLRGDMPIHAGMHTRARTATDPNTCESVHWHTQIIAQICARAQGHPRACKLIQTCSCQGLICTWLRAGVAHRNK